MVVIFAGFFMANVLPLGPSKRDRPVPPEGLDVECLEKLLRIMGAEAANLLRTAADDLEAVQSGLAEARPQDWIALRRDSHDLISLAGTLGEHRLRDLARVLNIDANNQRRTEMEEIDHRLAALIAYLHARGGPR